MPSSVTYAYDAAGNRILMTDGHGSKTYQYDLLSRLTQETRQFAVGAFSIGYTYNLAGQLMSVTDPFNDSISYTRNLAGQLKTVFGSVYAGTSSYITDVSYRAWGAPNSIGFPGTTSTTAYNTRLLPTQYRHTANSSGASIMSENYGYFPDGELASLTDLDDTPGSNPPATLRFLSRAWAYDQMGRVIQSNGTGSGSMPGVPYTQSYTYDAFGNMTSRGGSYYNYTFQPPSSDTATYTNNRRSNWSYNADGEVVSTPLTTTDQPRTTTYDAAGRMLTSVETGQFNTITYSVSYDGDGQVVFESSNTSPGTSESSYIVRSTVLGGEVLTRLDQSGNKKSTHVPAEGFLFATQQSSGAPGAFVEFTHRNPHEVTETNKAVYDPLGNYMPFQASGDPRPPAGSFTSATMRGLSASQANPYSSAVGCLMDGLPTNCVRVAKAIGRGEVKKLIIDGRGQNPNVALGNMGWFLVEFPTHRKIAQPRPRLGRYSFGPKPVIKDPYKIKLIDREVNWAFRLISFQPQNPGPGVDFLRDNSGNTSYGPGKEKMIFDAILALYTDDCINAFKAAGLKDPFTLVTGAGGGVVIGPSSLATNSGNTGYMGVPEQARREILSEFGNTSSRAFTVMGRYTSDGRPRMFLNASAFASGLGGLVSDMAHEFVHAGGVKGVKPPWYKPWQDDLSFDSKYQKIIDTCRKAAQSFIDTRR